jgi:predicted methyltransferase
VSRYRSTPWPAAVACLLGLAVAASTSLAQRVAAPSSAPNRSAAPAADINARFLDPQLDPREWINRFEVESREVFAARQAIARAAAIKDGQTVADIGAGTGLFTLLFAHETGSAGWVYAVDISPRFVEHIAGRADKGGVTNVTPVLCTQSSVSLPPASIDVAFVCDTYHHFEHPAQTLASIYRALRPGGRLVVVDFIREEGVSSDWILNHVRAGKAVVTREIESAGFQLLAEPDVQGLTENYVLAFQKPSAGHK